MSRSNVKATGMLNERPLCQPKASRLLHRVAAGIVAILSNISKLLWAEEENGASKDRSHSR